MPIHQVTLSDHDESFLDAGIADGRFSSLSEAVGAGLQLLEREAEQDRMKIERLRCAAQDGIDAMERGDYSALHSREEISALVRKAGSARR